MPSFELFEQQDAAIAIRSCRQTAGGGSRLKPASPLSWYRWVGLDGDVIGMTTFGASGPYQDVLKHFGFTVENVVERALKLLARLKTAALPRAAHVIIASRRTMVAGCDN